MIYALTGAEDGSTWRATRVPTPVAERMGRAERSARSFPAHMVAQKAIDSGGLGQSPSMCFLPGGAKLRRSPAAKPAVRTILVVILAHRRIMAMASATL